MVMIIIQDTREQLPLFDIGKRVHCTKLEVGDYTSKKLLNIAHIERKSPNDLYGSIIQGHERFRNMLIKAMDMKIELVIFVECPEEVFYNKEFKRAHLLKASSTQLRKMLATMQKRYNFTMTWCHGREDMQIKTTQWLRMKEIEIYGDKR